MMSNVVSWFVSFSGWRITMRPVSREKNSSAGFSLTTMVPVPFFRNKRATGKALLHLRERRRRNATGVAAVPMVELVIGLVARDADLVDVGDDDEVTGIHVRREDRLVLAAKPKRDLALEPAEHLVGAI